MRIESGQPAPDFRAVDDTGREWTLADFAGKTLVLYFYPRDNTSGCSQEARDFRDLHDEFTGKNAVVVGVSKDSVASHQKFRKKLDLPFILLSDPDRRMIEAYGVWQEKKLYGKTSMGVVRTTVVIGPDGKIERVYPKVKVKGHARAVLDALGG